ncbi:probable phosphoglycerate mutase [Nitrosomonas sp. PY1]|uniref:histidine phosphatase family protein n=1 Tax=Nitrosomonas sp. PY1 TaxID=1803906 RepID=UPI001FC804F3|nr:histidine phosphatase family protein [Nitrosomonas sp. PY1]GKS69945.1 probable phosphoglycerate mutase [Nitrosomonas sp. PY1]
MPSTIIDLIRHGEPVGGHRYRGYAIDDPLTEKGWSQMWSGVGACNTWDHIITSPLQRCQVFAHELGERYGIDVTVESRFKEVGFGVWEGLSHDAVKIDRAAEYSAFIGDPVKQRPDGAEPLGDFIDRVSLAYQEIVERHRNNHVLIVTHAGVIRAIIAQILDISPKNLYLIKVNNGGITRIRYTRIGAVLEMLNGKLTN